MFVAITLRDPLGTGNFFILGCVVSYEAKPLLIQHLENLGIVGT